MKTLLLITEKLGHVILLQHGSPPVLLLYKDHGQKRLGEKRVYLGGKGLFHLLAYSPSDCRSVGTQEAPRDKNWSRRHEGTLLTGLFPMSCSNYFFIPDHLPGQHYPQWAAPPTPIMEKWRKCPTELLQVSLMEAFTQLRSPFPNDSSVHQVDRKLTSTLSNIMKFQPGCGGARL